MITQEELKEILHYDPETGSFTWLVAMGTRARPGDRAGAIFNRDYIRIRIRLKRYVAHRLAWLYVHGHFPTDLIDHVNGVKYDNRLCNLRPATRSQNLMNRRMHSNNTSGLKGVYWHKGAKKWKAQCRANGKHYHLGLFENAESASAAYQAFAAKHHGAFFNDGIC